MWNLGPILSSLTRHRTTAALLSITVAVTVALVSNALHLTGMRLTTLLKNPVQPETEVLTFMVRPMGQPGDLYATTTERDLLALRAIPGVKAATHVNQVPYGRSNWGMDGVRRGLNDNELGLHVSEYLGGPQFLEALGLRMAEGRDFTPDEFRELATIVREKDIRIAGALVNREVAAKLFPGESPVGKTILVNRDNRVSVLGVVDNLIPSNPKQRKPDEQFAIVLPATTDYSMGFYVLRIQPAQREAIVKQLEPVLMGVDTRRKLTNISTLAEAHSDYDSDDRQMAWLMAGVIAALLAVTGAGIVGLASFWVQQRHRMIGTRRALGATRGDIVRYFLTENFLLTTGGLALGMLGAYALSMVLMRHWALPALPWFYLPLGAVVMWLLGLAAVFAPAWRAANLPPVAALRGQA